MAGKDRRLAANGSVLIALALITSCGGGGGTTASLRVVQASPDQAAVNVLIDGKLQISDLSYAGNTGYLTVNPGTKDLQLELYTDNSLVLDEKVPVTSSSENTVVITGNSGSLKPIVLADSNTAPTAGDIEIRVMNAAPGIAAADVYIVPAGVNISTLSPVVKSLAFQAATSYQTLTAGTYEVFLTVPGTKNAYVSSGPLVLTGGEIRTMVALNGAGTGFTALILADLN